MYQIWYTSVTSLASARHSTEAGSAPRWRRTIGSAKSGIWVRDFAKKVFTLRPSGGLRVKTFSRNHEPGKTLDQSPVPVGL